MGAGGSSPPVGPRLVSRWTGHGLEVVAGHAVGRPEAKVHGAVWGLLSQAEAEDLVTATADRRVGPLPERPWLSVSHAGESLVVGCSPMLPSGVFWGTDSHGNLVVATDPLSVAQICGCRGVDDGYVRDYLFGEPPAATTAFPGVGRLDPGYWFRWSTPRGGPRATPWCGPEIWEEPHLRGRQAVERYVAAFDRVVEDILPYVGTPVVALSGGLDSTFLAGSLARTRAGSLPRTRAGPALALHSAPLPVAGLDGAASGRDADETPLARQMAQMCGFELRPVINHALMRPLDAAAAAQSRSGVPTYATGNQIWMNEFDQIAASVGALAWFTGWHGNASFSYGHGYAEEYYLGRGRVPTAASLMSGSAIRKPRQLAATAKRMLAARESAGAVVASPLPGVPPWHLLGDHVSGRQRWLRWLAFRGRGLAAARNPAAGGGIVSVDPFAAPSVLAVAAAIEPSQWRSPGLSRAFARRAGRGRVPDAIRLRTRRGQQSADMWYVIRHDRDEYLDRIAQLPGLPGLERIDALALSRHVARWPWGQPTGPPREEYVTLDRILAMAQFVSYLLDGQLAHDGHWTLGVDQHLQSHRPQ